MLPGRDRPPAALARYTGFLMGWCAERSRLAFFEAMQEIGLHPREFAILAMLASAPGPTQQQLAQDTGVDPSTMVATLDVLATRGLAERRIDDGDRRRRTIHLTGDGETLLRRGQLAAKRLSDEAFADLSAAERDALHATLLKLAGVEDAPG